MKNKWQSERSFKKTNFMGKRKFFDILLKENLNKYSNLKYLSQKIAHLAIMYSWMYMERINDFNIYIGNMTYDCLRIHDNCTAFVLFLMLFQKNSRFPTSTKHVNHKQMVVMFWLNQRKHGSVQYSFCCMLIKNILFYAQKLKTSQYEWLLMSVFSRPSYVMLSWPTRENSWEGNFSQDWQNYSAWMNYFRD